MGSVENLFHNMQAPRLRHQSPMGGRGSRAMMRNREYPAIATGGATAMGRRQGLPEPQRALLQFNLGFLQSQKLVKKREIYSFLSLMSMPYFAAFLSAMAWMSAISASCRLGLNRWRNLFWVLRYSSTGFLTTFFTLVTVPSIIS